MNLFMAYQKQKISSEPWSQTNKNAIVQILRS